MRLLIAGWQGQIASALVAMAPSRADVTSFAAGRPALDLCELPTLQRALSEARPDVIINAAAYTAVDNAESDVDAAYALNRDGPRMLAELAADYGAPLIHLSTDYVFDGQLDRPYKEADRAEPVTVYGQSKLAGEQAVATASPKHIILRTSWVYSETGKNFVRSILDKAGSASAIDVVSDQIGTPTYANDLAAAIFDVAAAIVKRPENDPAWGIYHASGGGEASWFTLAQAVMCEARAQGLPAADVKAIASSEYPTAAARLTNARLDCSKLQSVLGIQLPEWQDAVRTCVRNIALASAS